MLHGGERHPVSLSARQGPPFNPDPAGHACLCIQTITCILLVWLSCIHTALLCMTILFKIDFSTKIADCAAVLTWGKSGLPHQNFSSTGKTSPSLTAVNASSACPGTQPGSVAHQSPKHALLVQQPSVREIQPMMKH